MVSVEGQSGHIVLMGAEDLTGAPVAIQNCSNSVVLLLGNVASVTVDECTQCLIIVGACKGSVFVRDSRQCTLFASCQQFRCRDTDIRLYLNVATEPIIERCQITVQPNPIEYDDMQGSCVCPSCNVITSANMERAGLWEKPNLVENVRDFTPETSTLVQLSQPAPLTSTHIPDINFLPALSHKTVNLGLPS